MNVVVDFVVTGLTQGVGEKSGKEWFSVEGTVISCREAAILSGVYVRKFVSKEIFLQLVDYLSVGLDRLNLKVGVARSGSAQNCDLGLNLFINDIVSDKETVASSSDTATAINDKKSKGGE